MFISFIFAQYWVLSQDYSAVDRFLKDLLSTELIFSGLSLKPKTSERRTIVLLYDSVPESHCNGNFDILLLPISTYRKRTGLVFCSFLGLAESTIVRKLEVLGLVYSPIVSANLQKQAEFPGASYLSSLVA